MGNCRGCAHLRGHKDVWYKGKDVAMFRCGYAEEEFGGERWVAEPVVKVAEKNHREPYYKGCEVFKSVIPDEGPIEFLRDCVGCNGKGVMPGTLFTREFDCSVCSGTGKVEMFPNDDDNN